MALPTIPNWPVLVTEWAAGYNSNGGAPVVTGQNVELSPRVLNAMSSKRGKQYELDTAMAGELSTTLRNNDAVLDPTNASGPFAGHIMPYQPFQIRAQYPPTPNLLPAVIATGGEGFTAGTIPASFGVYAGTDPNGTGSIVASGGKQGSNYFSFVVPTGFLQGQFIAAYSNAAAPLTSYTLQAAVQNATSGTTGPIQLAVGFFGVPFSYGPVSWSYGPTISAVGASGWYETELTFTTPAGCTGIAIGLVVGGTYSAQWTCGLDQVQLEQGSTASAFVAPGTWYPLFSGFVERWPTEWNDYGSWGTLQPTITDAFALLSQGQLSDPLTEEINAIGATWLYRLDDSQDAVQAAEANGKHSPLKVVSSKYGVGSVSFGNSITAASPAGVFNTGGQDGGGCVTVTSPNPGSAAANQPLSVLSLNESGINGPANPKLWTRMIAFRWGGSTTIASGALAEIWSSYDRTADGSGAQNCIQLSSTGGGGGQLFMTLGVPGVPAVSAGAVTPAGFTPFDGNWHLVIFGNDDTAQTSFCSVDGVTAGMVQGNGASGLAFTSAVDSLGGSLTAAFQGGMPFSGDLAYAAEFPTLLTASQVSTLYSAWRNACSGESSAARYARILRYAKYTGPTNIGTGLTTAMGPASDLDGSDALSCLNNVVTTENGTHFVARDGTITFQGRNARYNVPSPSFVFGENTAAGEYPYESLKLDYDTTHLANDVTVTQTSTSQNFFATNPTSMGNFFDRTMTRSVNVVDPQEAQDCANYLATRYGSPLTRVDTLTLNPAAQPALWPVILQLELGMCIQVNRRPPGCPQISLLVWIEQLSWDVDDKGNFTVSLQCSPVDRAIQGQFAIWGASLATQATAGTNTVTIASATDMVNPLDASLAPGMAFQIHTNGAVAFETLTVKTVQATGPNWTTGTLTFTSNLARTHPVGTVCGEPTNGAAQNAYNANAAFGAAVFTY